VATRSHRPSVATRGKGWVIAGYYCLRYVLIPRTNPSLLSEARSAKLLWSVCYYYRRGSLLVENEEAFRYISIRLSYDSQPGKENAVMPLDVLGRTRATLTEPAST